MKTGGPYSKIKTFKTESRALLHTWGPSQHKTLGNCTGCMPWKLALFPLKMILLIYLFLAVLGLLLSFLCVGFLCLWQTGLLSSCGVRASHCGGFSCWGAQALGCVGLSSWGHMGLVALQHVGSSRTRDQTHVPCIGRQILIHSTTRKVLALFLTIPRESLRLAGLWPHHSKRARSRLMSEAKQGRTSLVLGWEAGWRQREPKEDWVVPRIAEVILFPVFNLSGFAR